MWKIRLGNSVKKSKVGLMKLKVRLILQKNIKLWDLIVVMINQL